MVVSNYVNTMVKIRNKKNVGNKGKKNLKIKSNARLQCLKKEYSNQSWFETNKKIKLKIN